MIPPINQAMSPEKGGTPLTAAIPKQSGTATKKTTIPAGISDFRLLNLRLIFFCGMGVIIAYLIVIYLLISN